MTARAQRALELALALQTARARARRLEAELGRMLAPQRSRFSGLGGSGTPAAREDVGASIASPPPAEGDLIPILPTEDSVEAGPPTESGAADLIPDQPLIPGLPERPLRRTEELPPLEGIVEPRPGRRVQCGRCRRRGHRVAECPETRDGPPPTDPVRLAELRAHVQAGTYDAGARLREVLEQERGAAILREQAR